MDAGSVVTTWLPGPLHDKLIQMATRHDRSVSSVLRQIVTRRLRDTDAD